MKKVATNLSIALLRVLLFLLLSTIIIGLIGLLFKINIWVLLGFMGGSLITLEFLDIMKKDRKNNA